MVVRTPTPEVIEDLHTLPVFWDGEPAGEIIQGIESGRYTAATWYLGDRYVGCTVFTVTETLRAGRCLDVVAAVSRDRGVTREGLRRLLALRDQLGCVDLIATTNRPDAWCRLFGGEPLKTIVRVKP